MADGIVWSPARLNGECNGMFVLIHTMTITDSDYVIEAQSFHAAIGGARGVHDFQLLGRRVCLRMHRNLRGSRYKQALQRLNAPNLRTLMKRNSANIKHNLRTVVM